MTNPLDPHSFAVREGLERKGVSVACWHTSDFPSLQRCTLAVSSHGDSWSIQGPGIDLVTGSPRSVWLRRPEMPVIPDSLAEEDRLLARRESILLLHSLWEALGDKSFWVNPRSSDRRSQSKLEQLRMARRAGFTVPQTLCSNDPAAIREFLRQTPRGAIFKSLFPMSWEKDDRTAILFTARVREADLPQDSALSAAPGLFQEEIPKAFELRVTVLGHRVIGVKLRSQEVAAATVDYRAAMQSVPLEPFEVPAAVAEACHKTLSSLGLVFGCFDLIVTPEGEFVFLEVNEMGAFLWLEEALPELPLLDSFCELLRQATPDWKEPSERRRVRFADVAAAAQKRMEGERSLHRTPAGFPEQPRSS